MAPMTHEHPDDFDSPWKEALEQALPDFLALFFPQAHAGIDWSRGHRFRDKELQQVVRDAELGRRYADKLAEVYSLDGAETWVLVHIEIQGQADPRFAERMYVYHYRLFDRYRRDVVSLAVLTDAQGGFRPSGYERERWGCSLRFRFPMVKLLDWHDRAAALEADRNPFALVALAQLQAMAHRGSARKRVKLRLIRFLYQRDYTREEILAWFRVLDWMLRLPEDLELEFREELIAFEEETQMPYVTSVERIGIQKGLQQGLEQGRQEGRKEGEAAILLRLIALKFGSPTEEVRARIEEADADTLLDWSTRILTADRVDDIFR
jgi:predicted transposase YdaD